MEIGKFSLHEFTIDNTFKKSGDEAIVSKAWHPHLGHVAIKEWTNDAYKVDNEIKLLIQNCDHQNIVQFLGILMNNESNYIGYIIPYMALGSLHDVIHNKAEKYDEKQISNWITQICCGLSHLHFKKIIHRNIKPSNVLLGKSHDDVKLSDLGMVKSLKNIAKTLTKGLGADLYMAPEIFKDGEYNFSADIYSLSITIWEILHRRKPFDHVECSSTFEEYELLNKIYNGERPELKNNLSKEISDLLMRCWHVDASKRPTINHVAEFINKTDSVYTDFQNVVNERGNSLGNLNVHNNDDEALAKIPFKSPAENFLKKQTILLLGGWEGKKGPSYSLLVLENNGQNWKQLNIKLPYGVYNHGAQFLNNNLYIFGGVEDWANVTNWTYKLSKSLQWEKITDMNQKRSDISNSSVILNNQTWVCGGRNEIYKELKSVEMYDPLTNKWKYMKEMNESRATAAAAVVNGKIFCSGGIYINSIECYDPSSDAWTPIRNMPQNIFGHGAIELDGHFIVIGGSIGVRQYLSKVWALDARDKNAVWIEKSSMSIPRIWFSIEKINGKVFVCGGQLPEGKIPDDVEIFDGEVWNNGPKMPTERWLAPAVVIPVEFAKHLS